MDNEEKHFREMNIGSHIMWGAAMWGSAEAAKESKNYLNTVIGYYYSVFHIGFALINTDHTFHMENMSRMNHSKIESWLENHFEKWKDDFDYKNLRAIRENISYLGMDNPSLKLQVVKGGNLPYQLGSSKKVSFFEMVEIASESSKRIFEKLLIKIETFCKTHEWQPLQWGREYYIDDYLDDDILSSIIPREKDGKKAMSLALNLILGK